MSPSKDFRNERFDLLSDSDFFQKIEQVRKNNNFENADLRGLNFSGRNLNNINFSGSLLHGTNFRSSDLLGSQFQRIQTGVTSTGAILVKLLTLPLSIVTGIMSSYSVAILCTTIWYIIAVYRDEGLPFSFVLSNISIVIVSLVLLVLVILITVLFGLQEYLALSVLGFICFAFVGVAFLNDDSRAFVIICTASLLGCFTAVLAQSGAIFIFLNIGDAAYQASLPNTSSINLSFLQASLSRIRRKWISIVLLVLHTLLSLSGLYLGARQAIDDISMWISIPLGGICLLVSYILGVRSSNSFKRNNVWKNRKTRYEPYEVISSVAHSIVKPFFFTCFSEARIEKTKFQSAKLTYANFSRCEIGISDIEMTQMANSSENHSDSDKTITLNVNGDLNVRDFLGKGAIKVEKMEGSSFVKGSENDVTVDVSYDS